jgi:DNA polymerase-3 subunit epsilon
LGDARVLWDFVQLIHAEKSPDEIAAAVAKATKTPSLPSGLERCVFDALPQGPGVYLFYGDGDSPLYIGKGVNVRARAQAHFAADHGGARAARLAQEVKRIEAIETAGELGALLLEARLVKEKSPLHNRHLRRGEDLCSYRFTPAAEGGVALERVDLRDFDPHDLADLYGVFKSRKEAVNTLRDLAAAHGLCHQRVGLECGRGPCHAYQIKRCRGVCAGKESVASHDLRMKAALSLVKIRVWPFPGSIAIREYNADTERSEWHVFDAWCHLGSVSNAADLHEAIGARDAPKFDLDTYRILKRELERRANTLEITRLDTE